MKGYCIGYGALHSPSSSVGAVGDIWDSRDCVWSVAPCYPSPGWGRELPPAAAAATHHGYNCKGHKTRKCQLCWYRTCTWSILLFIKASRCQDEHPHLMILSSLRLCRALSLLYLSFSRSNGDCFLLLHFSILLLGSQSAEGSLFSRSPDSLWRGYAMRHRFPSSSSSKLTDTTPESGRETAPDSGYEDYYGNNLY